MKNATFLFLFLLMIGVSSSVLAQEDPRRTGTLQLDANKLQVQALYPAEKRLVVNDHEIYVGEDVVLNGQLVSGAALLNILREGQTLKSIRVERSGTEQQRVLEEVTTL
jgi:hypothetical protein